MCSRQSSVYKKGNGVFLPETGLLNSIHYFSNSPWIKELYLFNIYNRKCSIYNVAIEFSIYNFDTRLGYILFIFPHWFGSSIFPEFSLWSMFSNLWYVPGGCDISSPKFGTRWRGLFCLFLYLLYEWLQASHIYTINLVFVQNVYHTKLENFNNLVRPGPFGC